MIKGIGIDSVDQDRISKIFIKYGKRFQDRILGPREKRDFEKKINQIQKIRYLSNNFACKEAFSKVLGLGFSKGVAIKEIEILRNDNGKRRKDTQFVLSVSLDYFVKLSFVSCRQDKSDLRPRRPLTPER